MSRVGSLTDTSSQNYTTSPNADDSLNKSFAQAIETSSTGPSQTTGTLPQQQTQTADNTSYSHYYHFDVRLCSNANEACTVDRAWDALKHNAFPGQDPKTTVKDGEPHSIFGISQSGSIKTYVDDNDKTEVNVTEPSHLFYSGKVTQHVYQGNGGINLSITGEGSNSNLATWGLNYPAGLLFPSAQRSRISNEIDQSFHDQTGRWPEGSVPPSDDYQP